MKAKPKVAVHKFSSCDGCQLAFLNMGADLLRLAELVDIVHFAEAGMVGAEAKADIAFVEGSIATEHDERRIRQIRADSDYLITIGACATAGGLQALRNLGDGAAWVREIYAEPAFIDSLVTSTPVSAHVKVDLELWGCPVTSSQVLGAVRALLYGVAPAEEHDKVCMDCKRGGTVCVLVSKGEPCMGPVTRTGCGALCPRVGRDCYACFGPAEAPNTEALGRRLEGLGLMPDAVARRFLFINSAAPDYAEAGRRWREKSDD